MNVKQVIYLISAILLVTIGMNAYLIVPSRGISLFVSFLCGIGAGGFLVLALKRTENE